jgi:hypothetical protein
MAESRNGNWIRLDAAVKSSVMEEFTIQTLQHITHSVTLLIHIRKCAVLQVNDLSTCGWLT